MNRFVLQIYKTLKKCVEYFKYNENDPYEGIKSLEQEGFSNYLLVTESIEDYISGKRSVKRRFVILILQFSIWTFALKSLFISYYNNRIFSKMTGDFTYLYPRPDIINIVLFLFFAGSAIIGKNSLLIRTYSLFKRKYDSNIFILFLKNEGMKLLLMEHKNKCEQIKIFHQMMNYEEYQINRKYMRKFYSILKLSARIMSIGRKVVLLIAFIQVFTFTIIAYFDPKMNFSVFIMLIWIVILFISFYYMSTVITICCVFSYMIALYMKYRFQQVEDMIDIYLQRGNTFQTIKNIKY